MRDAGAKVAVELTDQESVRLLLRGAGSPLPASPPAPPEVLKAPSAAVRARREVPADAQAARKKRRRPRSRRRPAGRVAGRAAVRPRTSRQRRMSRRPRNSRRLRRRRRQPPEPEAASSPARAPPQSIRGSWRSASGLRAPFRVYSWYHSLVKVTPAVDTAWPSDEARAVDRRRDRALRLRELALVPCPSRRR